MTVVVKLLREGGVGYVGYSVILIPLRISNSGIIYSPFTFSSFLSFDFQIRFSSLGLGIRYYFDDSSEGQKVGKIGLYYGSQVVGEIIELKSTKFEVCMIVVKV